MDDISLALNPPRWVKHRRSAIRNSGGTARVWPLASINVRAPVVLDTPGGRGVDLAYPRVDPSDAIAICPVGTSNGTATHLMPPITSALAIDGGEIVFAGRLGHGFGVIINHGNGWASHYANLQTVVAIRTDLYRTQRQYVRAGDTIGYVGAPEPDAFKRLHFELWERDRDRQFVPVDARRYLTTWKVLERYDAFTPPPPGARSEAD
jgi:murein DD-endopeptidase MepM/ murein hydrolase activator NlpD